MEIEAGAKRRLADEYDAAQELAAALAEARERFPSNKDFAVWLASNEIDIGGNDRAALILMATDLATFRDVLTEQTETLLPNTVWQKHRDRFQMDLKTPIDRQPESAIAEKPIDPPENVETALTGDDVKMSVTGTGAEPRAVSLGNGCRAWW